MAGVRKVQSPLVPSTADTPLDSRTVVQSLEQMFDIEMPYLGMLVYCRGDGKTYRVESLAPRQIGDSYLEDAMVGGFSEFGVPSRDGGVDMLIASPPMDCAWLYDRAVARAASTVRVSLDDAPSMLDTLKDFPSWEDPGLQFQLLGSASPDGPWSPLVTSVNPQDRSRIYVYRDGRFVQIAKDGDAFSADDARRYGRVLYKPADAQVALKWNGVEDEDIEDAFDAMGFQEGAFERASGRISGLGEFRDRGNVGIDVSDRLSTGDWYVLKWVLGGFTIREDAGRWGCQSAPYSQMHEKGGGSGNGGGSGSGSGSGSGYGTGRSGADDRMGFKTTMIYGG